MVKKVKTKRPSRNHKRKNLPEESLDIDPRRSAFAAAFYDPTSDTYGRLVPSGIKAGFTKLYSQNLTSNKPDWLLRIVEKMGLMNTVKKNIKIHLELKTEVPVMTAFGPYIDKKTKKMVTVEIKQIILMPQNAQERRTVDSRTNGQAIPRLSEAS